MRKSLLFLTRTATALLLTLFTATTALADVAPCNVHFGVSEKKMWKIYLSYGDNTVELSGTDANYGETPSFTLNNVTAYEPTVKVYYHREDRTDYDYFEIPNVDNCHYTVNYVHPTGNSNQAKVIITTIANPNETFFMGPANGSPTDPYYQYVIPESETIEIYYTLASTPIDNLFEKNEDGEYLITCLEDWNKLAAYVADGNDCEGLTFKMTADVGTTEEPVTTMIGCVKKVDGSDVKMRFAGTFDGGNNTLTVALNSEAKAKYCAPFSYLQNATIKNLHVAGTVTTTGEFASGLVGSTGPDNNQTLGKCTIDHCQVSVELVSNYVISGSRYGNHGGFIGIAEGSATITNSWFDGKFSGSDYSYSAGFIGINKGKTTTLTNCLFNPQEFGDLNTIGSCEFVHNLNSGQSTLTAAYWVRHFGEPENAQGQKVVAELSEEIQNGEEELSYYVITLTDVPDGNTYYIVKHNPTWEDVKAALEAGIDFDLTGTIEAGTEDQSIVISPAVIPSGVDVTLTLNGTLDRGIAFGEAQANGYVIKVEEGATLTIIGGTITGGNNTGDGGGLYNEGTLNIFGTTITGNFTGGNGGGIYNKGTLNIDGATITANQGKTAEGKGIGIYVAEGSIFNVKGKVLIDGNCYTTYSPQQKKTPHNVYLAENEVISIAGALTTGSSIGVEGTDDVVASYADAIEAVNENALPSIFKNDTQANVKAYNDGKNQQIRWNTDNKRLLTANGITVTLPTEVPVYTGSAIELEGIVVKDGETDIKEHCEFTYSNNVNAGTAKIIISAKEESETYIGSRTETFTIAQKPVTIKADDKTKTYGNDTPTFTASAEGLVDVDAESVINCTFTCEEGEEAGEYDIIPSEATIMNGETNVTANYDISYANGTLKVFSAVASVTKGETTTYYTDFDEAVADAMNGRYVIVLLANVENPYIMYPGTIKVKKNEFNLTVEPDPKGISIGYFFKKSGPDSEGVTTYTFAERTAAKLVVKPQAQENLTYTALKQNLIIPGVVKGGWLEYSLNPNTDFSKTIPAKTEAGEYYVYYRVVPDDEHYGTDEDYDPIEVVIHKATVTPVVTIEGWTYGEEPNEPVIEGVVENGEVTFTYAAKGSAEFSTEVPEEAGMYVVKATVEQTPNYMFNDCTAEFSISWGELLLADDSDNSEAIDAAVATGSPYNVVLQGRTLYKDGTWNTLCLPFDLSAEQIAAGPLAGATIMSLDVEAKDGDVYLTRYEDNTLFMHFADADAITAGVPYIVKWAESENVTDPTFEGVVLSTADAVSVTSADEAIAFKGLFAPEGIYSAANNNLYLADDNNLYWPTAEDFTVNAFRAYFQLGTTSEAPVRRSILSFGEGATRINSTSTSTEENWYDLSGRQLTDRPAERGIYIVNGKKVVVK